MTTQLYLVPLDESQATTPPQNGVQSRVDLAGLLEQGGVAAENIATSSIDLTIEGNFNFGPVFSEKLATELKSLGESSYSPVPLYDADPDRTEPDRGYYEVESVDVNPAHKSTGDAQQFSVSLTSAGTRETHWRAVRTTTGDSIETGLATGSSGLIGIPADDLKERWFDTAHGSEVATPTSTVEAEFGTVALFDPDDASFDDPTLLFEQPYQSEGPVDVRVWDGVGELDKYASFDDSDGGTVEVPQWVHAYHGAFEFDGFPIVDNGLIRVGFDEPNGQLDMWEWDDSSDSWSVYFSDHGDYELFDADVGHAGPGSFGPSNVDVFTEFEDTSDGSIHAAILSFQRGIDGVVVRQPPNGTIPSALEDVLEPIASDQTTDPNPSQGIKARSEVK